MISVNKVIEIYSLADDFLQLFSAEFEKRTISHTQLVQGESQSCEMPKLSLSWCYFTSKGIAV